MYWLRLALAVACGARAACPATRFALLEYVTQRLDDASIPYFVTFGTLLGGVRDGGVIPWTQDVDLCVPSLGAQPHFWRTLRCLRSVPNDAVFHLWPLGPAVERVGGKRVYVDVYGLRARPNGTLYAVGSNGVVVLPRDAFFPIQRDGVTIHGRTFAAPRSPTALLRAKYGDAWRVADNVERRLSIRSLFTRFALARP